MYNIHFVLILPALGHCRLRRLHHFPFLAAALLEKIAWDVKIICVLLLSVGLAVRRLMYCSIPRLIVLTPLLVSPFHLQRRST
jgi:hypothetical protein